MQGCGARAQSVLGAGGALMAGAAVALSAVAAHAALEASARYALDRAATMLGWHGLALLVVSSTDRPSRSALVAGAAFLGGGLLFAVPVAGAAFGLWPHATGAPAGGAALIAGWMLLVPSRWRTGRK